MLCPVLALVNSSNSPDMTVLSPDMCAMPSPTSVTTEASWRSTVALIWASCSRRVLMIFSELIVSVIAHHFRQR